MIILTRKKEIKRVVAECLMIVYNAYAVYTFFITGDFTALVVAVVITGYHIDLAYDFFKDLSK